MPIPGNPAPAYCTAPTVEANSYYALGIQSRLHNKPTRLFGPKSTPKAVVTELNPPPTAPNDSAMAPPPFNAADILSRYPSPVADPPATDSLNPPGEDARRTLLADYNEEVTLTPDSTVEEPVGPADDAQPLDPLPMYGDQAGLDDPYRDFGLPPILPTGLIAPSIASTYDKYRYEKALKLKTVLDTMHRPQMPPGFTLNVEHNLRVATININGINPIKLAYIIQLLVLHDIDVLTIQDTRLSTNQGDYYAEWFKDLMGPGSWAKAFSTTAPKRHAYGPKPKRDCSGGQLILVGPRWGSKVLRTFKDDSELAILTGVQLQLEQPTLIISMYWPFHSAAVNRILSEDPDAMSSTALAMRLYYYLRRKRLPFSIPTYIHRHIHTWYTKLMDSSPDGAMIVLGDFNQTMTAEKGGSSHYDPIRIWMEYYGLDNFLWNACKEYPKQYKYSPTLHRQTTNMRDATPKRITRNPIHLLHRPSPALTQVAAWSSIHPMEEGYTDHQLVIGEFIAVPKVPLQALPKNYKAIPPHTPPGRS